MNWFWRSLVLDIGKTGGVLDLYTHPVFPIVSTRDLLNEFTPFQAFFQVCVSLVLVLEVYKPGAGLAGVF